MERPSCHELARGIRIACAALSERHHLTRLNSVTSEPYSMHMSGLVLALCFFFEGLEITCRQ